MKKLRTISTKDRNRTPKILSIYNMSWRIFQAHLDAARTLLGKWTTADVYDSHHGILIKRKVSVKLTSLNWLVSISYFWNCKHYLLSPKQATLIRRSTVQSLSLQLVFLAVVNKMRSRVTIQQCRSLKKNGHQLWRNRQRSKNNFHFQLFWRISLRHN
jgi:hypothetical protein